MNAAAMPSAIGKSMPGRRTVSARHAPTKNGTAEYSITGSVRMRLAQFIRAWYSGSTRSALMYAGTANIITCIIASSASDIRSNNQRLPPARIVRIGAIADAGHGREQLAQARLAAVEAQLRAACREINRRASHARLVLQERLE